MAHDREVAGLRCTEVLARLSDYLDGDLSPEEVAQVQGHLRGCDWCERFGSQMGEVVGKLRRDLATPPAASPDVARRLMERLDLD